MEPLENLRGKLENLRGQLENLKVDGKNWKTWEEMEQLEKALDIHCSSLTNSFSCLLC